VGGDCLIRLFESLAVVPLNPAPPAGAGRRTLWSGSFPNFFGLEELFEDLIGLEAHDPFSIDHEGRDGCDS
jgi:hypothetical protein